MPIATDARLRSIFGGSVGNLVEWFDWYAYAAFSLYFARSFFPTGDLTAQLLNGAAVFAVGFLMRPIGAWVLGRYADRRGRKAALTLSVLMMGAGSLLIACVPTYATIGVAAPCLLLLARLLQGFSVGGEYAASATYLAEVATPSRRGYYSSFQYVTLILGQLLAMAVLLLLQFVFLNEQQLEAWGWRVPFFIGALCSLVALWLRRDIEETAVFLDRNRHADAAGRVGRLLRHPQAILTVVGLTAGGTVAFYTFTTYAQKFMVNTTGFTRETASLVAAGSLLVFMLLQPLVGAFADRVGRRPVLLAFGVLGTLCTYPLLRSLERAPDAWAAFLIVTAALTIVSGYTAINAIIKAELFPSEIRALGVGLPYSLTVALFGGTAEYIALWFKSQGFEAGFYWYVTGCTALSLLVYATMPETRDRGSFSGPASDDAGRRS
jgi:MHS family alpha-ketoglutarate permease-like MFS transporter